MKKTISIIIIMAIVAFSITSCVTDPNNSSVPSNSSVVSSSTSSDTVSKQPADYSKFNTGITGYCDDFLNAKDKFDKLISLNPPKSLEEERWLLKENSAITSLIGIRFFDVLNIYSSNESYVSGKLAFSDSNAFKELKNGYIIFGSDTIYKNDTETFKINDYVNLTGELDYTNKKISFIENVFRRNSLLSKNSVEITKDDTGYFAMYTNYSSEDNLTIYCITVIDIVNNTYILLIATGEEKAQSISDYKTTGLKSFLKNKELKLEVKIADDIVTYYDTFK